MSIKTSPMHKPGNSFSRAKRGCFQFVPNCLAVMVALTQTHFLLADPVPFKELWFRTGSYKWEIQLYEFWEDVVAPNTNPVEVTKSEGTFGLGSGSSSYKERTYDDVTGNTYYTYEMTFSWDGGIGSPAIKTVLDQGTTTTASYTVVDNYDENNLNPQVLASVFSGSAKLSTTVCEYGTPVNPTEWDTYFRKNSAEDTLHIMPDDPNDPTHVGFDHGTTIVFDKTTGIHTYAIGLDESALIYWKKATWYPHSTSYAEDTVHISTVWGDPGFVRQIYFTAAAGPQAPYYKTYSPSAVVTVDK